MDYYYHDGKKRSSPLSEEQFRESLATGKITEQTLVWRSGMMNWKRWRDLRLEPDVAALFQFIPGQEIVVCQNCGKPFSLSEVVTYENLYICTHCKPEFIQRLKEGAPLPGIRIDPANFATEIIRQDYDLNIGGCLNSGFNLLKEHFWLVVGTTLIILAYIILFNIINRYIPLLGNFANLILSGPLYGGVFYFFIRLTRGKYIEIGDLFDGFKGRIFWQLLLGYIVPALVFIVGIILIVIAIVLLFQASPINLFKLPKRISTFLIIPAIALVAIPFFFLYTPFIFSLPLILDKKLHFWQAIQISFNMIKKHWFKCFSVFFVSAVIGVLGISCCIGILVTIPIFYGAMAYAYIEIFKG